ncbi:Protein of unknown function (DUF3237) domain containing protein [Naviculisporaceae sp. PSN 640]
MKLLTLTVLSLLSLTQAAGPPPPKTPKPPSSTYLYTLNITGGATYPVGAGPYGFRLVVPILGGSFSGPRLRGTVMPVGGEWGVFDASHENQTAFHIDVRQTLKTDDGAYIQVMESGASQPPDGRNALVTMRFDTGSEKYYWINNVVAFGVLRTVGNGTEGRISIDCWALDPPV